MSNSRSNTKKVIILMKGKMKEVKISKKLAIKTSYSVNSCSCSLCQRERKIEKLIERKNFNELANYTRELSRLLVNADTYAEHVVNVVKTYKKEKNPFLFMRYCLKCSPESSSEIIIKQTQSKMRFISKG
jgi:hypothetical protein